MTTARGGVALAEVAVALVLVVVGWGALIALQQRSVRTGVEARLRDEARWLVQAIADSIEVAGAADASGRRDTEWGWVQWAPEYGGVSLQAWSSRDSLVAELWTAPGARP